MIEKDDQGRGWELKYAIYLDDTKFEEDEAIEFVNALMRASFKNKEIVDWDGPL